MQRHIQQDKARRRRFLTIIGIVALILIVILITRLISNIGRPAQPTASLLPCNAIHQIAPFGQNILYYDDMSIHCISPTGATRWSHMIGSEASFSVSENAIVAWSGSQIYVLDQNGKFTYNNNLGENIQFARIGKKFVAAVVGEATNPTLLIMDMTGGDVDRETAAYANYVLLDVGYYGDNGEYMWSLSLDVYGTVANYILHTFQVGHRNTGQISLGENLIYSIIYDNSRLRTISTRQMRTFDSRGTEDLSATSLVFGWKLIDHETYTRGDAYLLFAQTAETRSNYTITQLRLFSGTNDKRFTLPSVCIGAGVYDKKIYAIGTEYIYRADINAQRFTPMVMPLDKTPTGFLGLTSKGVAIVTCGNEVYAITMP